MFENYLKNYDKNKSDNYWNKKKILKILNFQV